MDIFSQILAEAFVKWFPTANGGFQELRGTWMKIIKSIKGGAFSALTTTQ